MNNNIRVARETHVSHKDLTDVVAERLAQLRFNAGLTQTQIASALNFVTSTYQHWESGRARASIESLIQLCQFHNLKGIDELLSTNIDQSDRNKIIDAYNT